MGPLRGAGPTLGPVCASLEMKAAARSREVLQMLLSVLQRKGQPIIF